MPSTNPRHWQRLLQVTQPEQVIGLNKLRALVPDMPLDSLYSALRTLRLEGLVTVKRRNRHPDGSLVTFHKTALPKAERDIPTPRYVKKKKKVTPQPEQAAEQAVDQTESVFRSETITHTRFTLTGGTYEPAALIRLARKILQTLPEDQTLAVMRIAARRHKLHVITDEEFRFLRDAQKRGTKT